MNYETIPTNRIELRLFAMMFRVVCGFNQDESIDPVMLLDRLPDYKIFKDVRYEVIEDHCLPNNIPAQCKKSDNEFIIQIKESVYMGAYKNNVGGHRMHIMHEIMHAYADKLGFKPIFSRQLSKNTPPFRQLEWIVKALAGEVMMPYDSTNGMSCSDIMQKYGVSKAAAEQRLKY